MQDQQHNHNRSGVKVSPIYLLPNMFTLGAMFCGFYAIIQSISANFIEAGIATFVALILDSIDGRLARLTHSTSPFGAQLDSLSDMVNFGVAPAVIAFNWQLHAFGRLGWLIAFVYCACAGLRLARFNTMIGIVDKKFFLGMPSPTAAALTVGFIYMCANYNLQSPIFTMLGLGITVLSAFSMVSNIRFYSFKEFNFHHRGRFRGLLFFLFALGLCLIYPDMVIYSFFVLYALISYFMYILRIGYKKKPA